MMTIKVRNVGNSLGLVLPKELVARLRVASGDRLFVQETVDGIQLTPYDPEAVAALAINLLTEQTTPATLSLVAKTNDNLVSHVGFRPVACSKTHHVIGSVLLRQVRL